MREEFEEVHLKTTPSHRVRSETFQLVQSLSTDVSKTKRLALYALGVCCTFCLLSVATSIAANELTQSVRTSSPSAAASLTDTVVLDNGHGAAVGTHSTFRETSLDGCDAIEEIENAERITIQTDGMRFVGRVAGVVTVPTQLSQCGYLAIVRTMDGLYDVSILDDDIKLIPKNDADFAIQAAHMAEAAALGGRRRALSQEDSRAPQTTSYSMRGSVQTSECQETKPTFDKTSPGEQDEASKEAFVPWAVAEYIVHGGPSVCGTEIDSPKLPVITVGSCELSDLQLTKIAAFLDDTEEASLYDDTILDDTEGPECLLQTGGKPDYTVATVIPSQCPDEVKALVSISNLATAGKNIAANGTVANEIRDLLQDQSILDELENGRKLLAACGVFVNVGLTTGSVGMSIDLVCVVKKVWGFLRRLFGRRRNSGGGGGMQ